MKKQTAPALKTFDLCIQLRPSSQDEKMVVTKVQTLTARTQMFTFIGGTPKRIATLLDSLVPSILKSDEYQARFASEPENALKDNPFSVRDHGGLTVRGTFDGHTFRSELVYHKDEVRIPVLTLEKGAPAIWLAIYAFLQDNTRQVDEIADTLRAETV